MYFAEGVITTLVSLGTLKNLKCLPENFPCPATKGASSLTESDNRDGEEEEIIRVRQPTPAWPDQIPYPPTEENIQKLKAWFIKESSSSSFNITSAPLAKMVGPPMKIHLDPEARPVAIHKPIPIPHDWQDTVKEEGERDIQLDIIDRVPMGVPTTWHFTMVVVVKKSGKPCRTVDLSPLNKHCLCETFAFYKSPRQGDLQDIVHA